MQSNVAASSRLDEVLREEREQAAADRQSLLSQITSLVVAQGEAQDSRLTSKIQEIQKDVLASKESFESSTTQYSAGMDCWNEKETQLVEEVLRSRETLKSKLKEDWVVSCLLRFFFFLYFTDCSRLRTSTTRPFKLPLTRSMQRQSVLLMSR